MSEEVIKNEIKEFDDAKIEKIKSSLQKIENKTSKFLFCIPDSNIPNASSYEIYFHATSMKKLGFDVKILTEKKDFVKPFWVDENLMDLEHISMENTNISVGPEDVMVIPEIFSNIMEQTKELPCIRIAFLQSIDYMISSLLPGIDWSVFGVQNVITTSNTIKEFMVNYFNNKFNIKTYNIGIPDYFNKTDDKPQNPIISIVGRNQNEIGKIVKLFYAKYPQYSFITFDNMLTKANPPQAMRRVDFAERLKTNFAAVWIDRISSFGTFPLECMKSGVIPIAIKPDVTPEYLLNEDKSTYQQNTGAWTTDLYMLPMLIGDVVTKFLDDSISDDIYNEMKKISDKYSVEESEKQIQNAYLDFLNEKVIIFKKLIEGEN